MTPAQIIAARLGLAEPPAPDATLASLRAVAKCEALVARKVAGVEV